MSEGRPENDYANENVRGSADGEISEDVYPQMFGESDEAYAKRLSDMREYMAMAQEDGDKADAAEAAEAYAKSKVGRYEAMLRAKVGKGVYTDAEVDQMVANAKVRADDAELYERWKNGERRAEHEGENVRGSAGGEISFDMYPRMKGESSREYGDRLKMMHELMKMAREDGEKADAAKAAEDYAASKLGKFEAMLRAKVEKGVYTEEEVSQMVEGMRQRLEDSEKYEQWLEKQDELERELGETAIDASELGEKTLDEMVMELLSDDARKWVAENNKLKDGENLTDLDEDALRALYEEWAAQGGGEKREAKRPRAEREKEFYQGEGLKWIREMGFGSVSEIEGLSDEEFEEIYQKWLDRGEKDDAEGDKGAKKEEGQQEGDREQKPDEGGDKKEGSDEKKDEKKPLTAVNLKRTRDAEVAAHDIAEMMLKEDLEAGGKVSKFLKGIWKGNMFRGYYIEKNRKMAYEQILAKERGEANGLGDDKWQSRSEATINRFISEYDEMIHKDAGEWREALPENHPATIAAKEAISKFARGELDEANFMAEMGRMKAQYLDGGGSPKGEVVLDNYLEIARTARGRFEHEEGIESILEGFKLINGEARASVRTEPHLKGIDKLTNWVEHSKFGKFVPPELVAGAASIALWMAQSGASNVARAVTFGVGGGIATGIAAGLKEGSRVSVDRAQRAREVASGLEVNNVNDYDRAINKTLYDMAPASKMTDALRAAMESKDPKAIMRELALADARIGMSDTREIDLVCYSDPTKVEDERFALDLARAEARVMLKSMPANAASGEAQQGDTMDVDRTLATMVRMLEKLFDEGTEGDPGIIAKDKVFRGLRRKQMLKQGAKTAAISTVMMLGTQELVAAFDPNSYGLTDAALDKLGVEGPLNLGVNNLEANNTFLAGVLGFRHMETIYVDGKPVKVDAKEATEVKLSDEEVQELRKEGYKVTEVEKPVVADEKVEVPAREFAEKNGVRVTRDDFGANGTPLPDNNELNAHYTADGRGIVTRMSGESTTWGGESINFQEAVADGKIRAFVSLTEDSQSTPVEVIGRLVNGGPQVEFIPEPDSAAAACFENGKFIGRYFEIAFDNGSREGVQHIIPLATAVGRGIDGAMLGDTIERVSYDTVYNVLGFELPTQVPQMVSNGDTINPAALLPFVSRKNLTVAGRREQPAPTPEPAPAPTPTPPDGGRDEVPADGGNEEPKPSGEGDGEQKADETSEATPDQEGADNPEQTPSGGEGENAGEEPVNAGGEAASGETPETGDYDAEGEPIWENLADRIGGSSGVFIVEGGLDTASEEWRNALYERWWNDLSSDMKDRFAGRSSNRLSPESDTLFDWLQSTGKMVGAEEMYGDNPEIYESTWNGMSNQQKEDIRAGRFNPNNREFVNWLRNNNIIPREGENAGPQAEAA